MLSVFGGRAPTAMTEQLLGHLHLLHLNVGAYAPWRVVRSPRRPLKIVRSPRRGVDAAGRLLLTLAKLDSYRYVRSGPCAVGGEGRASTTIFIFVHKKCCCRPRPTSRRRHHNAVRTTDTRCGHPDCRCVSARVPLNSRLHQSCTFQSCNCILPCFTQQHVVLFAAARRR